MKVDIIMATYNGDKYIENQLLSLLQQTYKNWVLYIHDDGSSDNTIDIIKKYTAIDSRIKLIDDNVTKLGVGKNFLHCLKRSTSDYAIFCDQDDIWLETKVEDLVNFISKNDSIELPILAYCDGYPWINNDLIRNESIAMNQAKSLQEFIFYNGGYQGCSIIMNRKLIDMTLKYEGYVYHHDDFVSLLAHSFGKVLFVSKKLMLYRQHSQAVTGIKEFEKSNFQLLFNNVGYVVSRIHFQQKKAFFEEYKEILSQDNLNVFIQYFNICNENSKVKRLLLLINSPFTYGGKKLKLIAKFLFQDFFSK